MEYLHKRYNAIVRVDDNGKKTIHKHDMVFRTFNDLVQFEREGGKAILKNTDAEIKEIWYRSKGE